MCHGELSLGDLVHVRKPEFTCVLCSGVPPGKGRTPGFACFVESLCEQSWCAHLFVLCGVVASHLQSMYAPSHIQSMCAALPPAICSPCVQHCRLPWTVIINLRHCRHIVSLALSPIIVVHDLWLTEQFSYNTLGES